MLELPAWKSGLESLLDPEAKRNRERVRNATPDSGAGVRPASRGNGSIAYLILQRCYDIQFADKSDAEKK